MLWECQVSGGKGYLLQEAQDVGALECRPFETPPLRVEDVVGHGTGVGSIGMLAAVLEALEAMEVFASAAAAVSAMPLLSPASLPLMHKIGDALPSSVVSPASPTSTSTQARRRLLATS